MQYSTTFSVHFAKAYPADTKRNRHVIITSKRHFDVIITCLLRCALVGSSQSLVLKFEKDTKNALDQKHAVVRYLWIFARRSTAYWWQTACKWINPHRLLPSRWLPKLGAGSGSKYPMPKVPGKPLPKVSPRDLSWIPWFLTFSATICFILWKNVRCITMQTIILCQPSVDEVLSNLPHDFMISLRRFKQNGMEANPNKFKFFICSPCPNENIELKISDNVTITSEPCVKALGTNIDNHLTLLIIFSMLC